jgi:hypothetical protein
VLRPNGAIATETETEIAEMTVGIAETIGIAEMIDIAETIDIATGTMGTMGFKPRGSRATATA